MDGVRILPAGEQGLVVEFGNEIDVAINARVHGLAKLILSRLGEQIIEVVPTYRSLLVYFNPLDIARAELLEKIECLLPAVCNLAADERTARVVHIPVCYGGEFGPDLDFVARHNNLSCDEVIAIHTSKPYLVYMLGFTPGFPYLGGMSERIAAPRLEKPRTAIPAGSVGIAGSQTGLYPVQSPGGWRIIGRTPLKAFDERATDNPFAFRAGDYLKFEVISPEQYHAIKRQVDEGGYVPLVSEQVLGGMSQ